MSDLRSRDFLLLLTATFGSFSNYAPLLSVVPLWSAEGGSGHGAVGSTTGVVMGTTVLIQLAMPRLLRACGARHLLVAGALLLGLPTFLYPLSAGLPWVLAVSAARGFGFGIVAVAGSALVAELVGPAERGRAVGMYGVAVGLPQVVLLPLGVWAVGQVGFGPVFAVTGALSVLSVAAVRPIRGGRRALPASGGRTTTAAPHGYAAAPPRHPAGPVRPLLSPWAALTVAACALGGVTAFLPLVLTAPGVAALALFVLSSSAVLGRWVAGVHGDRHGTGRLLLPSALACAAGMAGLSLTGSAPAAVAAAGVYGLGFGALQNDTLVLMFARSTPEQASTVWNIAYDGGTGLGAVAIGLLSRELGLTGAFAVSAALIALVAPVAYADARRERRAAARTPARAPAGTRSEARAGSPSGSPPANGAKDAPAGR